MICPTPREIEQCALGQLEEPRASAVRAHLASCERCAVETRWIADERRLFARRAALPAPAPPAFTDVMARVREGGPAAARGASRAKLWSALAAAAALVGFYVAGGWSSSPSADEGRPSIVAEAFPAGEACEGPYVPAAEIARATACAEDARAACLVATPAPAFVAPTNGSPETECSVTCAGDEPHEGEALESRAAGDRAP